MALIVALAVTVALAPMAASLARRLDIVDHPGPLKVHEQPVPYLGGVAVYAGLAGPVAVERPALLAPLGLALVVGLVDDATDLPPQVRLVLELAIGAVAAWVVPARGPVGALVTVAFVVVLLNAVNLLDGLDGLASGVGLVSALGLAAVLGGGGGGRVLALALAGALGGFLVWNRPPARIYLGDAGSYLVGTGLAVLLATAFGNGQPVARAGGSLLLVGIPVADTAVAILRRLRAGRPLLRGDRGHVYDQLVDRGWPPTTTVLACIAAQAILVGAGIAVTALPAGPAIAVTAGVVVLVGSGAVVAFTSPSSWTR